MLFNDTQRSGRVFWSLAQILTKVLSRNDKQIMCWILTHVQRKWQEMQRIRRQFLAPLFTSKQCLNFSEIKSYVRASMNQLTTYHVCSQSTWNLPFSRDGCSRLETIQLSPLLDLLPSKSSEHHVTSSSRLFLSPDERSAEFSSEFHLHFIAIVTHNVRMLLSTFEVSRQHWTHNKLGRVIRTLPKSVRRWRSQTFA